VSNRSAGRAPAVSINYNRNNISCSIATGTDGQGPRDRMWPAVSPEDFATLGVAQSCRDATSRHRYADLARSSRFVIERWRASYCRT
jgi:hypothetical protein